MKGKRVKNLGGYLPRKIYLGWVCCLVFMFFNQCASVPETPAPVSQIYGAISTQEERFLALESSRKAPSKALSKSPSGQKSADPFPYKAGPKPSSEQPSVLLQARDKDIGNMEKNLEVDFVQASGVSGANKTEQGSIDAASSNKISPITRDANALLNVWSMFRNSPKSSPRILQSTSDFIKKNPKSWFGYVKLAQFFYERNVAGEPVKILRDSLGKVSDKVPIVLALVAFAETSDDLKWKRTQKIQKVTKSESLARKRFTSTILSEFSKSETLELDERLRILDTLSQTKDKNLTQSCFEFQELFENGRPNREVTYYYARCLHLSLNRDKALEVLSSGKRFLAESEVWQSESPREMLLAAVLFLELGKPEIAKEFWVSYERVSRSTLKSW